MVCPFHHRTSGGDPGRLFVELLLGARLLCSIFSGLLILRLFVIYHDQQHHAILPKSFLAEILMRVFGIFALSASSIWRSSHNHHHNHNSKLRGSHIGSFPIMTKDHFLRTTPAKRFWYLFARHPLTILFGYVFVFLFGMCVNPFINNPRKHYDCLLSVLVHVLIGTLLYLTGGWLAVLLTQTLPHFIAYAFGSYLFYAQHNYPGVRFADNAGWIYERAALDSSSYLAHEPAHGLVYCQHRLPPHSSPQRPHPVLSTARSDAGDA